MMRKMKYCGYVCMVALCLIGACATSGPQNQAALSEARNFDGTWDVTYVCPGDQGGAGYTFLFIAQVQDGVFHGRWENKDTEANLTLEGKIKHDGSALINASGALGNNAKDYTLSSYSHSNISYYNYHIDATFTKSRATGKRVEGRACTMTAVKRKK